MRRPRLNSAVATVAVETVFSLLRVAVAQFCHGLCSKSWSFRDGPRDQTRNDGLLTHTRAIGFHVKRIDGMAARHIEAVVLRSAEGEIGATLGQPDEGERLTLGIEHHHAVEVLGLALELEHLAAADFRGLGLQRAVAAPPHQRLPSRSTRKPSSAPGRRRQ